MKSLRVLHCIPTASGGGTESTLAQLLRYRPHGRFLHRIFLHSGNVEDAKYQTSSSAELKVCFREGLALARRFKPDVIHGWVGPSCVVAAFIGACEGIPFVLRQPTNLSHAIEQSPWLLNDLATLRPALQAADKVIVPSSAVLSSTRELCGRCRFEVIPNGIRLAPQRLPGSQPRRFELTTVGRLDASKGHLFLLRAVHQLARSRSDFRLSIIGDGEMRSELEAFVVNHQLENHVRFMGFRNDVPRFLRATDIFALPTLVEGMSNALLEAAAHGLPIVTTRIPENEFVLGHGKSAWLTPTADASALREAIELLMGSPEKRRLLGIGARKQVSKFTVEQMVRRHHELYAEVA